MLQLGAYHHQKGAYHHHQTGIFFSACQHSGDLSLFGKCFADNNLCPLQNVFVNNKLCFENSKSCFCCSMLPLYFCCKLMWLDHPVLVFVLVLLFVLVLALILLVVLVLVLLLVLVVGWCLAGSLWLRGLAGLAHDLRTIRRLDQHLIDLPTAVGWRRSVCDWYRVTATGLCGCPHCSGPRT